MLNVSLNARAKLAINNLCPCILPLAPRQLTNKSHSAALKKKNVSNDNSRKIFGVQSARAANCVKSVLPAVAVAVTVRPNQIQ